MTAAAAVITRPVLARPFAHGCACVAAVPPLFVDDLRPQVVAASLTAAFNVLTERGEGPRGKPKTEDDVAAQIDPIIMFLRGGLDALKGPARVD
jgi:hypothetical protein